MTSALTSNQVRIEAGKATVAITGQVLLELAWDLEEQCRTVDCRVLSRDVPLVRQALVAAYEALCGRLPGLERLRLATEDSRGLEQLIVEGILHRASDGSLLCETELLWQYAPQWLNRQSLGVQPLKYVISHGARHPLRSAKASGELYRRFIPWLDQTLTLHVADVDRDLQTFNRWMNTPRVAHFWEEQGDLARHQAYLQRQLGDAHTLPVIGRFDGIPFGYFEIYWAKEDRIAPFYDVDDYDRGLHLLVGEESYRGKAFYTAWFSSICHYMFLDDPRTQRLVCEPRHDNQRQIANFDRSGFAKVKHFDFPHKRALLVMLWRERFFSERLYQPLLGTENNL